MMSVVPKHFPMKPLSRLWAGSLLGALLGLAFFAGDLVAAFLHDGREFDPIPAGYLLLGVVAVAAILAGTFVGALLGLLWRAAPLWKWKGRGRLVAALLIVAISFGGSTMWRQAKTITEPPPTWSVEAKQPAHVLFVVLDTLRADTLYGESFDFPDAPEIGALAKESSVFADVEASAGWTIPSTATLLTGVYPIALGADRGYLPDWAPTYAEILRAAGWRTHAVVDNALLDHKSGFAAGYETYFKRSAIEFTWGLLPRRLIPDVVMSRLRHSLPVSYCGGDKVTDEAIAVIDRHEGDDPMLLYVHYMDVHTPYRDHPEIRPPAGETGELPPLDLDRMAELRHQADRVTDEQIATMDYAYRAELAFVDHHLGRLFEKFDERFGDEETMVIVTSDHGEEFYEHGSFGHGYTLYTELVGVPLVVRWPASAAPAEQAQRVIESEVGLVDVLPTTLDALGIDPAALEFPVAMHGRSLLPLVRGEGEWKPVPLFAAQNRFRRRILRWRDGEDVYLRLHEAGKGESIELYRRPEDVGELSNLTDAQSLRVDELARKLDAFVDAQLQAGGGQEASNTGNLDAIEALGYGGQ